MRIGINERRWYTVPRDCARLKGLSEAHLVADDAPAPASDGELDSVSLEGEERVSQLLRDTLVGGVDGAVVREEVGGKPAGPGEGR